MKKMIKIILLLMILTGSVSAQEEAIQSRYFYNGSNPNNYITFNDELWRILSFEKDGTIKIIKKESIGKYSWDEKKKTKWETATISKYLNTTYYKSIKKEEKKKIQFHKWYYGKYKSILTTCYGRIGLINIFEYSKSNSNEKCREVAYHLTQEECKKTNYLHKMIGKEKTAWTMTKDVENIYYIGDTYFPDNLSNEKREVYPVLYLKKSLSLTGKGTIKNPYRIEK